jgi:hypothetical protein
MCPCHSWLLLRFLGGSRNLTVRKRMSVMDGLWSRYYLKACLHIFVFSDLGVHVLHPLSFANELRSWLQEIDRRRSETMVTCISVVWCREIQTSKDNKSLIAENEKIKVISHCAHLESSQSVCATYQLCHLQEEDLNQQNSIGELKMRSINSLDSKTFSNGSIIIPESSYSTNQTKVLVWV